MQRMGMMIGIKPETINEYKRLHAKPWPEILNRLRQSHIHNYSIFLRQPENILFGYWEYTGTDFQADMAAIAQDPVTQKWWAICGPCQTPLPSRSQGEWWAEMEMVFHLD